MNQKICGKIILKKTEFNLVPKRNLKLYANFIGQLPLWWLEIIIRVKEIAYYSILQHTHSLSSEINHPYYNLN